MTAPVPAALTRGGDYRSVRFGVLALALLALVALPVAAATGGAATVWGAAAGVLLVALFFSLSVLAVTLAGRRNPQLMLPAAVLTYIAKIVVFGVLLAAFEATGWVDITSFAWVVVAGVLAWSAAGIVALTRVQVPYLEPERARSSE